MKHILIACLVFALCLAVGLFSLFYVRASGEETVTLLERSIRQAEEEQYTAAAESLRQAKQLWEDRETVLGIFLHHEEVDEILALFAQLEAFIKLEADGGECDVGTLPRRCFPEKNAPLFGQVLIRK